jgi:hypothetical protein
MTPLPLSGVSTEAVLILTEETLFIAYTSIEQECVRSCQQLGWENVFKVEVGDFGPAEIKQLGLATPRRGDVGIPALRLYIKVEEGGGWRRWTVLNSHLHRRALTACRGRTEACQW